MAPLAGWAAGTTEAADKPGAAHHTLVADIVGADMSLELEPG